jgi:suppressor for copper-sensitivity B
VQLPKFVYMINPNHETIHGSLIFGVMTAILSTPCTAPFMGTAAAWATQQASGVVLLVFGAIGVGMALPYFVLSANPKWVEKVPRTGPSSELIKQVMGLLMLAVAAFFIGTGIMPLLTESGHSPSQNYWWVVAIFAVGAMGWLIWKSFVITKRFIPRAVFTIIGVTVGTASVALASSFTAEPPIDWVYYTPQEFQTIAERGDVIVLDFTADWCLNCKVLERAVLYSDQIVALMQEDGIVAMKIDLTSGNEVGQAKLKELGSITIPLLAIFGPGLDEPWLGDSYSKDQVIEAVRQARGIDTTAPAR